MHVIFAVTLVLRLINFVLRMALAVKQEKKRRQTLASKPQAQWMWNPATQQWVAVQAP